MGCDIHIKAEKQVDGKWQELDFVPFNYRNYGMFGFLANVRNYSAVPPIAEPRGFPDDKKELDDDDPGNYQNHYFGYYGDHSFSWLSVQELLAFDYDQKFEDRRVTRQTGPNSWDGGVTGDPGEGEMITYREFLGEAFMHDLEELKRLGAERIVFGFDS